jgi:cytidylate kinase
MAEMEGKEQAHSGGLVYVVMGVSAAGKSTIGKLLAAKIGAAFCDAGTIM